MEKYINKWLKNEFYNMSGSIHLFRFNPPEMVAHFKPGS